MINRPLFIITILAASAFIAPAYADEADGSHLGINFEGGRTRAEVQAEASRVPRTRSTEPAGSRVAPTVKSTVSADAVREEGIRAARMGLTSKGEQ